MTLLRLTVFELLMCAVSLNIEHLEGSSCIDIPSADENGHVSYVGSQLWRANIDSENKQNLLTELENSTYLIQWGGNETFCDVFVEAKCLEEVSQLFIDNGIEYLVAAVDYQQWIDEENPSAGEDKNHEHALTWHRYHRLADINSFLQYVGKKFPSICTVIDIGMSVEENPLRVLKISNGASENKAVWVDGGIHAREWITSATITYIINYLIHNWENQPMAVQNINWHFLPVVNPDGYSWGEKYSSVNPCCDVYQGVGPFSEPETAAIENYILNIERSTQWKSYLSFHSYGQYIEYPTGEDAEDSLYVGYKMAEALSILGVHYKVVSAEMPMFDTSGDSDVWAKNVAGIKYVYTIELRDTGERGFVLSADNIILSGEDGIAIIKTIADAVDAL